LQENVSQQQAITALLQSEQDMQEMIDAGFSVLFINDTLLEAKKYLEGANYTAFINEINTLNFT